MIAVPNISVGDDDPKILRIAGSASLIDVDADSVHNRSVCTYSGSAEALHTELVELVVRASTEIDLSRQSGVHPRVGTVDVLPIVESDGADELAAAICRSLSGSGIAFERYGNGYEVLPTVRRRVTAEGREAVLVGVRPLLVAFNLNTSNPLQQMAEVARELRSLELPGLRCLAFAHPQGSQLSFNLCDPDKFGPADLVGVVAKQHTSVEVVSAEFIGVPPERFLGQLPVPVVRSPRSLEVAVAQGFSRIRRTA